MHHVTFCFDILWKLQHNTDSSVTDFIVFCKVIPFQYGSTIHSRVVSLTSGPDCIKFHFTLDAYLAQAPPTSISTLNYLAYSKRMKELFF